MLGEPEGGMGRSQLKGGWDEEEEGRESVGGVGREQLPQHVCPPSSSLQCGVVSMMRKSATLYCQLPSQCIDPTLQSIFVLGLPGVKSIVGTPP